MRRKLFIASWLLILLVSISGCTTTGELASDGGSFLDDPLGFLTGIFYKPLPEPGGETIRIATWNIENFGKTKASDPSRMSMIADTLSQYDLIAIQEVSNIREQSDPGCPRNEGSCPGDPACDLIRNALDTHLNQELGLNYSFAFSPQAKDERYLFVYDPKKVALLDSMLMVDPTESGATCSLNQESPGLMMRQPFLGVFRAGDFDFTLLTAHTSPGINVQELEGLEYFYRQALERGEPDVIILGDLNADCSYLDEKDKIQLRGPQYNWPVHDAADTTVGKSDCAYDRFVFTHPTKEDFAGSWGVDKTVPENVSDHYPVWMDFYIERDSD